MLSLRNIEDGACYIIEDTKNYVAWSMLRYASKIFWGCETIKELDRAKYLSDRVFIENETSAFSELIDLFQHIESSVLDAVRIVICFENYFKAVLLLKNYVIHRMEVDICRKDFPQFVTGKAQRQLLQKSTPILISDVKQAENHVRVSVEPLRTLNNQTIDIGTLLREPKYRSVYSKGKESDDRLFPLLQSLNKTRNSLHFLNIQYIAMGGLAVDSFLFLRDYVSAYIDAYAENFYKDNESSLESGKMIIENIEPEVG